MRSWIIAFCSDTDWPTLACPSADGIKFWGHEWEKHGTCVESMLDQHSYFISSLNLYKKANLLKALQDTGIEPDYRSYSVESIRHAIKESINFAPGLKCNLAWYNGFKVDILRSIKVGTLSDLRGDQQCLAIGNSFGLDHT